MGHSWENVHDYFHEKLVKLFNTSEHTMSDQKLIELMSSGGFEGVRGAGEGTFSLDDWKVGKIWWISAFECL